MITFIRNKEKLNEITSDIEQFNVTEEEYLEQEVIEMITHEVMVGISANEFNRINRLLAINSLEDMTDSELLEQGANTDVCEGIYTAYFNDGSSLNFNLCSGTHNYYDDVVWISADGKTSITFDCSYELGDIEVEINSELYIVNIAIEE